jgi:hypothetical protein
MITAQQDHQLPKRCSPPPPTRSRRASSIEVDEIEQVPAGAGRLDRHDHVGAARLQLSLPCLRGLLACDPDLSGGVKGGQDGYD